MEDILSQSEIDLLIKATLEPETLEAPLENIASDHYDFTKPNKFSKDQLRGCREFTSSFAAPIPG